MSYDIEDTAVPYSLNLEFIMYYESILLAQDILLMLFMLVSIIGLTTLLITLRKYR